MSKMRLPSTVLLAALVSCAAFGQTYTISTFAGGGLPVNVSATSASLQTITGLAVDSTGNIFMAVNVYNLVLRLDPKSGTLSLVAGNGTFGYVICSAAGARINTPSAVAVDSAGNLYIAEPADGRVSKISNGVISAVAGGGSALGDNGPSTNAQLSNPSALALDADGNLYIADTGTNRIRKVSNGIITTIAGNGTAGFSGDNEIGR